MPSYSRVESGSTGGLSNIRILTVEIVLVDRFLFLAHMCSAFITFYNEESRIILTRGKLRAISAP